MPDAKPAWFVAAALLAIAVIVHVVFAGPDIGRGRFFADQSYHFQTLRALSYVAADGADTSEVLEIVRHIRSGDAQGWFRAWSQTADGVAGLATSTADRIAKGRALLRAHNYYRTAEFFLPPDDPQRPESTAKNLQSFYAGLDAIGTAYERIEVPYGPGHHLGAVYYPATEGSAGKPLIVLCGGFDSTLEELYFVLVKAAHERGYAVLTYEGPGQGSVLRGQGLTFTPEWEKPTAAVMDAFHARHARRGNIVLIGMSMGGYLAPRAAAFDARFDGIVAYDVLFDMAAVARHVALSSLLGLRFQDAAWAGRNAMWVLGTKTPFESMRELGKYTLAGVAERITADVLILAGANDHFVPPEQVGQFEAALTSARSVTTKIYDRASGGAEHCQLGASALWQADLFDWMAARFSDDAPTTARKVPVP